MQVKKISKFLLEEEMTSWNQIFNFLILMTSISIVTANVQTEKLHKTEVVNSLRQARSRHEEAGTSGGVEKLKNNLKKKACQAFPFNVYGGCKLENTERDTAKNENIGTRNANYFGAFAEMKPQLTGDEEAGTFGGVGKLKNTFKKKACQAFPFNIYGGCNLENIEKEDSAKNEKTVTKNTNYYGTFAEMKAQLTGDVSTALGGITGLWDSPVFDYSAPTKTTRTVPMTIQELEYYNYFSAAIYCPTSLANLTCPYCDHFNATVTEFEIFYNEVYGTKAMVTLHPELDEIVVTFRGTVALVNWILDYQMYATSLGSEGAEVHTGLYLSLMSIYNSVVQEVGILIGQNPGFRVVVTGHSLGAAMASMFVYLMTSLDQFPGTNYALVTFGQPRVGNVEYADYMNALPIQMNRVVSASEGVPHIPPHKVFEIFYVPTGIVYVHHGQEVWLNDNEVYYCSKDVYEDPDCSNSIGRNFNKLDHLFYFDADYSICLFIEGWLNVDLFTVPGFTPTNFIPPVPTFMDGILTGIVQGGYNGLLPIIG